MATAAWRLPAELLSECLRAADLPTRVRASHVSHTWRAVALFDRRLWDSFECLIFRSQSHEDAMMDQLLAMLLRSHSLPFRLRIPHEPFSDSSGSQREYHARVCALEPLDVHRLALYDGPLNIFVLLTQDMLPLPTLTSLRFYSPDSYSYMELDDQFSERSLPSLQRLEAHCLGFTTNSDPHRALQHLTCSVTSNDDYPRLFECFPDLVDVQLIDLDGLTTLPPVSFPRSLRTIALRPDGPDALDVPRLLRNWAGEQTPRLVIQGAYSLHGVLPLFLASHAHRVELRLNSRDQELELITLPMDGAASRSWTITPARMAEEFVGGLETRDCQRLTSISVAIEQFGRLFAAQLETPGLEILELCLVGTQGWPALQADDADFFIQAPRLQRVVFNAHGTVEDVRAHMDSINRVISDLNWSFRALIVYDAELLESIAFSVPTVLGREIDCSAFARFAKEYTTCETD